MLSRRKPASADHPILELLRERWSARAFEDREVDASTLLRLFEAARWSPSSANEQPWRFVIARRSTQEAFDRLLAALNPNNQKWAVRAAVIGFSSAAFNSQRTGVPNRWAWYDTGQAMAHLSVQATYESLVIHQMAGFDPQRAREACAIPDEFEPVSAFAIGYPGDPSTLEELNQKRELTPRVRRPLAETVFEGRWGQAFGQF